MTKQVEVAMVQPHEELNKIQANIDAGINFTKSTLTMGWCIECHNQSTIAPGVLSDGNDETLTYYDEIHNRLVKHNKTLYSKFLDDDRVSPRELGGWECAKCHY
jgi:oligoribonuclease (3'-5' exoribonuclease)